MQTELNREIPLEELLRQLAVSAYGLRRLPSGLARD
ncbi:hypothetical protein, partial [Yersinia pseudotuberculosis]|uniref:Uncharacterized protein n=1 Tax=Yersinia pseudotuberculosis serotype O:3 (strain YPIII) TaxID=502800 RepID=A0A0H3B0R7_YERPY